MYSYYATDPRPKREAESLARAGMEVDVICLRRDSSEPWHLHYFAGDNPPHTSAPPEDNDMTKDELAQAFGGALDAQGRIVVPLADGNLYPLGNVLGFIHQELTTDTSLPARIKRVLAT